MANTFTQIHIQAVFAVKYRQALIHPTWEKRLYQYIIGIIESKGHKVLAINGISDHIHIFFGLRPTQGLSDLMREVKSGSSEWINKNHFTSCKFEWQKGYGGFSYRKSDVNQIVKYIANQKTHHQDKIFLQEYLSILDSFEIKYDEKYVFQLPE